jgi:hypothetical protein
MINEVLKSRNVGTGFDSLCDADVQYNSYCSSTAVSTEEPAETSAGPMITYHIITPGQKGLPDLCQEVKSDASCSLLHFTLNNTFTLGSCPMSSDCPSIMTEFEPLKSQNVGTTYKNLCDADVQYNTYCSSTDETPTGRMITYNFVTPGVGASPDFCQEIKFDAGCSQLIATLNTAESYMSLGSCQLSSDCPTKINDDMKRRNVSSIFDGLCSTDVQYKHFCSPTETVDVVVEVQGVTESNKDRVCEGFAEAVNGTTEYCSLSGPNMKRRRLTTNLYMDITVRDATVAVTTMGNENFLDTVSLPSEVKVATVTASPAVNVKVCPPNTIQKSGDCYCKHNRTQLASGTICPTSILVTSATTQQSVGVCFIAVLFFLGLLI